MYKLIDLADFVRGTRQRSTIRSIFVNFNKKIFFFGKNSIYNFFYNRKKRKEILETKEIEDSSSDKGKSFFKV